MTKLTLLDAVLWLAYPALAGEGARGNKVFEVVGVDCGRMTVRNRTTNATLVVSKVFPPKQSPKLCVSQLLNVGNRKHARTGEDYGEEIFDEDGNSMGFTVPSGMAKKPYRRHYLDLSVLGASSIKGMEALA